MKKRVAHQVLISLHRVYIPKVNEELHNELVKVLPEIVSGALPTKLPNQTIANVLNTAPNLKINVQPTSPKDAPFVQTSQKQTDAKQELLDKIKKIQQEQLEKSKQVDLTSNEAK
ncbi:hypothetical protein FACS1894166_01760 [Bacilli bacterium]|nr:hypothetical protein FACS1894166_01760 [Bacilli bacterium]